MQIYSKTPDETTQTPFHFQTHLSTQTFNKNQSIKPVLYVDDEDILLEVGKLFIERSGLYQVTTCNNPLKALELLKYNSFTAIVSDYEMPEMNGIELLKQVRKTGNPIPFIIFTGRGREEVVIAALNEGADFYIQKGGENKSQFAELLHKITVSIERREVLLALQESEKKLSNILAALPYATFAIDAEHRVIAWNKMMEQMTGICESDIIGKGDFTYSIALTGKAEPGIIDLILHDYPGVEDFYAEFRQEENVITAERYLSLSSGYRYVRIRAAPLYSSLNQVIGAIATIRDISDNFMDEVEDRKSFEMYKQIANISPDWEYWESPAGDVMYCSPSSLSVTGFLPEDFIKTPSLLYHIIHPDDRERVYQTQNPAPSNSSGHSHLQFRIITRNGEIRWLLQLCTPVYRMNRHFIGKIISNRDITERIELQERLDHTIHYLKREQEQNQRYQSLIAQKNVLALTSILELRDIEHLIQSFIEFFEDGIALIKGDTIIHCNYRFLEIFGYKTKADIDKITLQNCIPVSIQSEGSQKGADEGLSFFEKNMISFSGTYKKANGTTFPASVTMMRIISQRTNILAISIKTT